MKKLFYLNFIVFICVISAQPDKMYFERLSIRHGLSQATVFDIIQDKYGFLWFATAYGLNRFDGYKFQNYLYDDQDSSSISDNYITDILEDSRGFIWVCTNNGGLNKYDPSTEKFTRYKSNDGNLYSISSDNLTRVEEDKFGNLFIGTLENGLNYYNIKKGTISRISAFPTEKNSLSNNSISSLFRDSNGDIWIGTNGGGLNKYNYGKANFTVYKNNPSDENSISSNYILSIQEDKDGNLWIGTIAGLNKMNPEGKFTRYLSSNLPEKGPVNNSINAIETDEEGNIWLGTYKGLSVFNIKEGRFYHQSFDFFDEYSLSNDNVLSVFQDKSGLIWIGVAELGINKYNKMRHKFINISHEPKNPNSLTHNIVRTIYQTKDSKIWIGTLGGGLNEMDPVSYEFRQYRMNLAVNTTLSKNEITSVLEDKDGDLFIGTWGGGINKAIRKGGKVTGFERLGKRIDDLTQYPENIIQDIYQDKYGNIWVGTGKGLGLYDKKTNTTKYFSSDDSYPGAISDNRLQSRCISEDSRGNLWIGTWRGLNLLELEKNKAKVFAGRPDFRKFFHNPEDKNSLSHNNIISMYIDPDDILWIGTHGEGLNKFIPVWENDRLKGVRIKRYMKNDGLPSNIIYGIKPDGKGNLWLSTDNGLVKFNPLAGSFRHYYQIDGVQDNQFFWGAHCRLNDGRLVFGGISGITMFNPEEIKENRFIPRVLITGISLFGNQVKPLDKTSILKKSILFTEEIELEYYQNSFSIEFASMDFSKPQKNQFKYKLEGINPDYIHLGNRHYISFNDLKSGDYTLKILGSNDDGYWNPAPAELRIKIIPPFWKSNWFISLAVLFIALVISLAVYQQVRNLIKVERLRLKIAADLHDNIGSGLTEISILSEVVKNRIDPAAADSIRNLDNIGEKSRNLIDRMSDIVWLINPNKDSLYDLIIRLKDNYSEIFSHNNISFKTFELTSLQKVKLSMEKRQNLYLIFKEGITNCLKHSKCGQIFFKVEIKGNQMALSLTDDGKGFSGEGRGNGLKNMMYRAKLIGGSLTIESTPGKGTEVKYSGKIK